MDVRIPLCVMLMSFVIGTTLAKKSCTVDDYLCDRNNLLRVSYGSTEHTFCGVQLDKSVTATKPLLEYAGGDEGDKYLLLMVDPDAPVACFVHDLETMIVHGGKLKTHNATVSYYPPTPPSRVHRYQLFLYSWPREDDYVVFDKKKSFHLSEFEESNHLGQPIAVFQFWVSHK